MPNNTRVAQPGLAGIWCSIIVAGLALLQSDGLADDASTGAENVSQSQLDAANMRLLQKTVNEQQLKIAVLQAQVATLEAQLKSMGLVPASEATTQPVLSRPKRIIFIYTQSTPDVDAVVHRAVQQLDADQWFNLYTIYRYTVYPFQPHFVEASEINKQKFSLITNANEIFGQISVELKVAAQVHPDLIWLVGPSHVDESEDVFVREVRQILAGTDIRVDTALDFMPHDPKDLHLCWRISHETGGVCVDKDGNPMDEPPVPLAAPAPPAPAQPQMPNILRDKPEN
jgi:hypothetical protein